MRQMLLVTQYTTRPEANRRESTPKTIGNTFVMNCICEFTGLAFALFCVRAIVCRA